MSAQPWESECPAAELLSLLNGNSVPNRRPWESEAPVAEVLNLLKGNPASKRQPLMGRPEPAPQPWEAQASSAEALHVRKVADWQRSDSDLATSRPRDRSAVSAVQQTPVGGALAGTIGHFLDQNPILDLLGDALGEGVLRRVASTSGGEFAGPCPLCGGQDRLRVWPSPPLGTPRAWCRQCQVSGDALAWATRLAGRDPAVKGSTAQTLRYAGLLEPPPRGLSTNRVRNPFSKLSSSANPASERHPAPPRRSFGGPANRHGRASDAENFFSKLSNSANGPGARDQATCPGGRTSDGPTGSELDGTTDSVRAPAASSRAVEGCPAPVSMPAPAVLIADAIQLPGSRVTSAAVDTVAIDAVFGALGGASRTAISRCYVCRGTSWWRLRDSGRGEPGDWFCARCHAPVPAETRIERFEAGEARP
jgi:hypothetical protein